MTILCLRTATSLGLAALLLANAAAAFADAAQSFHDGNWAQTIAQGRAEATPAALVLAGRAQLNIAAYQTTDKARALELIATAEKDFDAALVKAPNSADAQIEKAIAIGYHAKLTRSPGLGKETKKRMEAVKAAHPDMALAWAAVGGWHGGAVATLGSFLASTFLGAHAKDAEADFAQAIKLDPTNPVHRTYYAMTLLDIDSANAAKAAAVLAPLPGLPTKDGFDALMKKQGLQLAAALKAGDAAAAQMLARKLQPFAGMTPSR